MDYRRRITLLNVLIAVTWLFLAAWSELAHPDPSHTLRILDGLELAVPGWWRWSLLAASCSLPALAVPIAFILWNPDDGLRKATAAILIAFPMVVFAGAFLAWLRIHYAIQ